MGDLIKIPRKAPHILLSFLVAANIITGAFVGLNDDSNTNETQGYVVYAKEVSTDIPIETEVEEEPLFTDEEIDLIALITMAEAEGESELGKRLVIDTILNRIDSEARYFPDTVYDVIYQKNAFEPVWNGRMERCHVRNDIRQLVLEEIESRTNYDVVYFTAGEYNPYGTPLFSEGNHYFSGH